MIVPVTKVWDTFAEFVRTETGVFGPDCQLKLLVALGGGATDAERVWLNGCYGAHHCVPSGYAVWKQFRASDLLEPYTQERLYDWLNRNWDLLPVRPEMRSHRMIEKRWRCLVDFAHYAMSHRWQNGTYEEVWADSISQVKYYSRYMAIKYLELLRMTVRPDLQLRDLRARNAWSPRIGLALMFPGKIGRIVGDRDDNSDYAIELAEECALEVLEELKDVYGIEISHFQLQVLLCNFREMLVGGFYPRAGHDEEMDYLKLADDLESTKDVWTMRSHLFPRHLLGEHGGWHGIQKSEYQRWKKFGEGIL